MSEHRSRISWSTNGAPFTYDSYDRTHRVSYGTGTEMSVSAAAEYRGDPALPNPEELLVAAAASCHMMTFLAIAARRRFVVTEYVDDAVGHLEADDEKMLAVTRIVLRPAIRFEGRGPSADELRKLHEMSHRNCFIARALRSSVTVEPTDPSEVGSDPPEVP